MKKKDTKKIVFNRRNFCLLGLQSLALVGLGGRLFYLDMIEGKKLQLQSKKNRSRLFLLVPERGIIVDRNNEILAKNNRNYKLTYTPTKKRLPFNKEKFITHLALLLDLTEMSKERLSEKILNNPKAKKVILAENLSWRDLSRIEVNSPDLVGVSIETAYKRFYPQRNVVSHVLGYVRAVTQNDIKHDKNPLLREPNFQIGREFSERNYDKILQGRSGNLMTEVNAHGKVMRVLNRLDARAGDKVELSIDLRLQKYAMERLSGLETASIVVIDTLTGQVLSLVSTPSYDNNIYIGHLGIEEYKTLSTNPQTPLLNKSISGLYAPGSTFKVMTGLAALENGISKHHTVNCPGYLEVEGRRFHCWRRGGHGRVDLNRGLRESCDVWFYDAARRIGAQAIAKVANAFSLGQVTGLGFKEEKAGHIPTPQWKKKIWKQPWYVGDTINMAIGQGLVLTTPLQLAVMTASLATGNKIIPRLTKYPLIDNRLDSNVDTQFTPLPFSKEHLSTIRKGMIAVVNSSRGTARRSRIRIEDFQMAGKTGTAQVRNISKRERATGVRKNKALPWRLRDHALFIAYAPFDAPRYAVSVVLEHGTGGASVASTIAHDVLMKVHDLELAPLNPLKIMTT